MSIAQSSPTFLADEYCRLINFIAYGITVQERKPFSAPRSREQLENIEDPWSDHILHLFNDLYFNPERIYLLRGGVKGSSVFNESVKKTF